MSSAWRTEVPLREEYVDYLGHVTAAAHLTLFEEAHGRWLSEVMDDPRPSFVLVRLVLDYRRELLLGDGPVQATVTPVEVTRSTVTVHEALVTPRAVHTQARAVLVRWDGDLRRSTPFLPLERERIATQKVDPPAG